MTQELTQAPAASQTLRRALLCTLFWGLLAHAYAFLHDFFSHDALNALYATAVEDRWKLELGRYVVPAYRALTRGPLAAPWLIGCLALLFLGLGVYFAARLFRVASRPGIFLLAGVMVTNATVTALTATYIYELDVDMLSVLLAVAAVYLWKTRRLGFLPGGVCLAACLGIYQCNISVAICLMLVSGVFLLLDAARPPVLRLAVRGVCMLAIGALLYVAGLAAVLHFGGVSLHPGGSNSLTNLTQPLGDLWGLLTGAYRDVGTVLVTARGPYAAPVVQAATALLLALALVLLIARAVRRRVGPVRGILAALLVLLLPLGANVAYVLNGGQVHLLMHYAAWLLLALPALLLFGGGGAASSQAGADAPDPTPPQGQRARRMRLLRWGAGALLLVLLVNQVAAANALYLKKNLEQEATLSIMTRVAEDIAETEGYEAGQTPVCFMGTPGLNGQMPGFEPYYSYIGADKVNAIYYDAFTYYYYPCKAYFRYILNQPVLFCEVETYIAMRRQDIVQEMPLYPAPGSIAFVDGVLVVKLGTFDIPAADAGRGEQE